MQLLNSGRHRALCVLAGAAAAAVLAIPAAPALAAPAPVRPVPSAGLFAWGDNSLGEAGDGTTSAHRTPVPVSLPGTIKQIVTTSDSDLSYTAVLLTNGAVYAWGTPLAGTGGTVLSPVQVTGLPSVTQLAAGEDHVLALDSSGHVWAWGSNSRGELGNGVEGDDTGSNVPAEVTGLPTIKQVAAGQDSYALDTGGTVWSWGYFRGLGTGASQDALSPVQVLTGATLIAAGIRVAFAALSDGTLKGWGFDVVGGLGIGPQSAQIATVPLPTLVPNVTGVTQLASNGLTTLAVAGPSGTVWGWGNVDGNVGDGTTTEHDSPVQTSLTHVIQVSVGLASAAVESNGTLLTWGDNSDGELGTGSSASSSLTPVQVSGLAGVKQASMSATGAAYAIGNKALVSSPNP